MQIQTVTHFPAELDEIARRSPQATFFHTSTWIASLRRSVPALEFRCLVARAGEETVGYLPFFVTQRGFTRSYSSLPFGTYGGPVADRSVGQALIDMYADLRHEPRVREINLVDFENRLSATALSIDEAFTHVLDLRGGFENVWDKHFDKSKRRQTRKAKREGIVVAEARSADDAENYHDIYTKRCDEWGQRFRYPQSLFVELLQKGEGSVRLFLARVDDELLGGHLNFYFRDTVVAWNGVTTSDSRSLQASTLLYSECIRHACENGYTKYNLGASLGKESLALYKESLGGVRHAYRVLRWQSRTGKIVAAMKRLRSKR